MGDYAPILPTAGVRQPTRGSAAARRSRCALVCLFRFSPRYRSIPSLCGLVCLALPRAFITLLRRATPPSGRMPAGRQSPAAPTVAGPQFPRSLTPAPYGRAPPTSGLRGERLRPTAARFLSATRMSGSAGRAYCRKHSGVGFVGGPFWPWLCSYVASPPPKRYAGANARTAGRGVSFRYSDAEGGYSYTTAIAAPHLCARALTI